ncbi:MAG: glutamyl-tRNA reductase, partial [Fulvivirga sp.]
MENAFKISGFSFKNTPLEIREKLALNEPEAKQLMRFLNQTVQANDLMVLSTCNRTEIYYDHELGLNNEIATSLSLIKGLDKEEILKHLTCTSNSEEAVNHLFEVAMGLDAQVVGDIQISNQVKKAYQWSADENVAGPFLHRLMHTIFYANKRVVQET